MFDDRTLERWMRLEAANLNHGIVRSPERLAALLVQDRPALETKGGAMHVLDRAVLQRLADALSPLVRASLRVPILFYVPHEKPGECYVADATAIQALTQLRLARTSPREGRLWMGLPVAREIARTHPTVFQFVRL